MRREISSSITGLYKVLVVLFFVGFVSLNLYKTLMDSSSLQIFFTSFSGLLGFFIVRGTLNLKRVELTDKGIIVSAANFSRAKEFFVPFEEIAAASQAFLMRGNPEIITIRFKNPTLFGDKIRFAAKTRFFAFFSHPIIEEINRKAQQAEFQFIK